MTDIAKYLHPEHVLFLKATTREDAIQELVSALAQTGTLDEAESFLDAVLKREQVVSTGIGMGVAIPHAKLTGFTDFFIAIGIQKEGIPWEALDGALVKLIFLIGGPDDKRTEYLQLLSSLTLLIKDPERRKRTLLATQASDVIALFRNGW